MYNDNRTSSTELRVFFLHGDFWSLTNVYKDCFTLSNDSCFLGVCDPVKQQFPDITGLSIGLLSSSELAVWLFTEQIFSILPKFSYQHYHNESFMFIIDILYKNNGYTFKTYYIWWLDYKNICMDYLVMYQCRFIY